MKKFFEKYIGWIIIIVIVAIPLTRDFFGIKKVGSFFEKSGSYYATYLINISSNSNKTKIYEAEAEIQRPSGDCYDYEEGGGCWRPTIVEEVYWPNGGKTVFSDCELDYEKSGDCWGNNDIFYSIELIKPIKK